jgi:hypothetical protein
MRRKGASMSDKAAAVQRAGDFLHASGRDIDIAIYEHIFAGGSRDAVAEALAHYQNEDGGFHGLEVDIAAPVSNPFATELALSICLQVGLPKDHEVLQKLVSYLEATQDDDGNWRFAPEVYEHPLAPWFQGWEWPSLNPSCTTDGQLRLLGLGSAQLHERVDRLFARLANVQDLAGNEFYGARPYASYLLPDGVHQQYDLYRWGVTWWLIRQANNAEIDGNHFFQYAPTPQSYTARALPADLLNDRLDRFQAEQEEDGGWPTPYDPRWRSWVTIQNLLMLRAFGRV